METTEFRPEAIAIPGQKLPYPARQSDMNPQPDSNLSNYKRAGKLTNWPSLPEPIRAYTPRAQPDDLRIRTDLGVGQGWPIDFADIEPYYDEVKQFLRVSGPANYL